MDVSLLRKGGVYEVKSHSGSYYEGDVDGRLPDNPRPGQSSGPISQATECIAKQIESLESEIEHRSWRHEQHHELLQFSRVSAEGSCDENPATAQIDQ